MIQQKQNQAHSKKKTLILFPDFLSSIHEITNN